MSGQQMIDKIKAAFELITPPAEEVARLVALAEAKGCGFLMVEGRPGTLRICPGTMPGQLIVVGAGAFL